MFAVPKMLCGPFPGWLYARGAPRANDYSGALRNGNRTQYATASGA
jgi:hypothetical protein